MDRETAIRKLANAFSSDPGDIDDCLTQLAEFREQLNACRTIEECRDLWRNTEDEENLIKALTDERAMEILQAEEAEKQPVASDDPFGGLSPTGG